MAKSKAMEADLENEIEKTKQEGFYTLKLNHYLTFNAYNKLCNPEYLCVTLTIYFFEVMQDKSVT